MVVAAIFRCGTFKPHLEVMFPISMRSFVNPRLASWIKLAAQAGSIAAAADLTVQLMANKSKGEKEVDVRRMGSFFAFNFAYVGFLQRLIHRRLDVLFGVQNTLRVIGAKVAVDTFLHGPFLYIPSFYLITGMLQGHGLQGSLNRFRAQYADTLKTYLTIWFVPMIIFFRFVPDAHRVLFLSGCGYIEKSVYSLLDQHNQRTCRDIKAHSNGIVSNPRSLCNANETAPHVCKSKLVWTEHIGVEQFLLGLDLQML